MDTFGFIAFRETKPTGAAPLVFRPNGRHVYTGAGDGHNQKNILELFEYERYPPTNEAMTNEWVGIHLLGELLGSLIYVHIGTMVAADERFGAYAVAALFSSMFSAVHASHESVQLSPLLTVSEIILYPPLRTWRSVFFGILSIGLQISGAALGARFTQFYYGGFTGAMERTLTAPQHSSITHLHIFISEAFYTFLIHVFALAVQYQAFCRNDKGQPTVLADDENGVKAKKYLKVEPFAVATTYFAASSVQYYTTGGSFIITRSLGPAMVVGQYTSLEWYFFGQIVGALLALVFIYKTPWRHA